MKDNRITQHKSRLSQGSNKNFETVYRAKNLTQDFLAEEGQYANKVLWQIEQGHRPQWLLVIGPWLQIKWEAFWTLFSRLFCIG